MEVDDIDETFFDRNIDEIDVRETPQWELSEEEESGGSDVETLVNQQQTAKKKVRHQVPRQDIAQSKISTLPPTSNPGRNPPLKQNGSIPNVPQNQSPAMKRNTDSPGTSGKIPTLTMNPSVGKNGQVTVSEKQTMSPSLYRHPLNKEKIDAMVKAAYKGKSDSVKDFGAGDRGNKSVQASKSQSVINRDKKETLDAHMWDEDDVDSVKDFTGNDRQKEAKYMERTDEAIYQRAAEEHIRRPPLWHDDEVDSVRDFSRVSGKQEPPSGLASQQLSRLPSDEHICLSPPWNEEDDGPVRPFVTEEPVAKNFSINNMVMEERMRQGQPPPWHEEDERDSTKDFAAQYRKTRSMENSRRPSEENIYLTPPWMEDDRQSCGGRTGSDHSSNRSYRMTLEEQRAIEEEVRSTGIAEAGDKVQVLRQEKAAEKTVEGVGPPVPGDSGFCSEQDQHAQQGQGLPAEGMTSEAMLQEDPLITKDVVIVEPPSEKQTATQNQASSKVMADTFKPVALNPADDSRPVNQPLPSNRDRPNRCAGPREMRSDQNERNHSGVEGGNHNRGLARSISQSSLEAMCYSPHDALDGMETSSLVSFASTAATHHDLDTRIDMVQSLLSMLGTHDKDDMSRTLLAMSNSKDSCAAMRQSGCLPLLIDLLHGKDLTDKNARREARARAGLALHNIVYSNVEDRRGRREIRVLRLLEIARAHCDVVQFKGFAVHPCAELWYPPLREYGPGPAIAALMKLSFEEDHRTAICELGGLQAIAELVQIDHQVNGQCKDFYSISLRKYAGMTITNLTFGNTKNKSLLCGIPGAVDAIIAQLNTVEEEEIIQVSASVLRNLSWRADEFCRKTLREAGAVKALLAAAQSLQGEPALRTTLSALWNLSAHCSDNKTEICATPGALKFFVRCLNYSSPSGSITVVESSGGILRNLSSHIAVRPDYRKTLRDCGCFQIMLTQLRSPSLRVVSNVCGALWNLSARCVEDQELLWELGAVSLFKSLINSKHKAIAQAAAAALRNLMAVKPGSSTDNESTSSRVARHYRSMPANMRSAEAQARIKKDPARAFNSSSRTQSPIPHGQATQHPLSTRQAAKQDYEASSHPASNVQPGLVSKQSHPHCLVSKQTEDLRSQPLYSAGQAGIVPVTRQDVDSTSRAQQSGKKKVGSSTSLTHSSSSSNHGVVQETEPSPSLLRSRSDVGPRALAGRQRRAKARGADANSMDSGASLEGRHAANFKWNHSNDSLAKYRRQPRRDASLKQNYERLDVDPRHSGQATEKRQHCRSSSDGCAVIPLLSDSYPLQVSHKPKRDTGRERSSGGTSVISKIRSVVQKNVEGGGGHYQRPAPQQGETTSMISPFTARRLNQWTDTCLGENYEMTEFGLQEENPAKIRQVVEQPGASDQFLTKVAHSNQKHSTQKFKSYRDSESDADTEIASEDERHLFGHPRKVSSYPEVENAWIQKPTFEAHPSRSADTESVASSTCSCDQVENVWIRRPDPKSSKKGNCGKCSRNRAVKNAEKNIPKKPMVKSRRDSTDSPISSPSLHRVFKSTSGREQKKNLDPSKRGVKVTSL